MTTSIALFENGAIAGVIAPLTSSDPNRFATARAAGRDPRCAGSKKTCVRKTLLGALARTPSGGGSLRARLDVGRLKLLDRGLDVRRVGRQPVVAHQAFDLGLIDAARRELQGEQRPAAK